MFDVSTPSLKYTRTHHTEITCVGRDNTHHGKKNSVFVVAGIDEPDVSEPHIIGEEMLSNGCCGVSTVTTDDELGVL